MIANEGNIGNDFALNPVMELANVSHCRNEYSVDEAYETERRKKGKTVAHESESEIDSEDDAGYDGDSASVCFLTTYEEAERKRKGKNGCFSFSMLYKIAGSLSLGIPANKHIRHVRYGWVKNVSNEYWPKAGHLNSETDLLQTDTLQLLLLRLAYGAKAERYPLRIVRKPEAKDAARGPLKSPWWTLGCRYQDHVTWIELSIQKPADGNLIIIGGGAQRVALTTKIACKSRERVKDVVLIKESGGTSVGDTIHKYMPSGCRFSPEYVPDCLSISMEHEELAITDREMAWFSGKVSLGNFPDLAGAVNKFSESVKNIEKNFDTALGLDDKPAGGTTTSEGKHVFAALFAPFLEQKARGGDRRGRGREGGNDRRRERKGGDNRGRRREGGDNKGRGREGGDNKGRGREGGDNKGRGREGGDNIGRGREGGDNRGREGGENKGRGGGDNRWRGREGGDNKG
ncbi:hypothetical protein Tco_0700330 [Tanacetum coccineum]